MTSTTRRRFGRTQNTHGSDHGDKRKRAVHGAPWVNGDAPLATVADEKKSHDDYVNDKKNVFHIYCLRVVRQISAAGAGRRTSTQHDAKKTRMKETRLEKCGRGDSHAEGGGACTRPTKKKTTPARRRAPRQHKRAITTAGDHGIMYRNHNKNIPCGL